MTDVRFMDGADSRGLIGEREREGLKVRMTSTSSLNDAQLMSYTKDLGIGCSDNIDN